MWRCPSVILLTPCTSPVGDWRLPDEDFGAPGDGATDDHQPSQGQHEQHGAGHQGSGEEQGQRLSDDFHLYAIEWEPEAVRFYFDSKLYATFAPSQLPADGKWAYDHPFFIILNVAVGGDWPGAPDETTVFPQQMLVDYVRVYQKG